MEKYKENDQGKFYMKSFDKDRNYADFVRFL